MSDQQLTAIPGNRTCFRHALSTESGFSTVETVAKSSEDKLAGVPGFGAATSRRSDRSSAKHPGSHRVFRDR